MNKIPMTEKQKNQIEEIYWKWFSKKTFKNFYGNNRTRYDLKKDNR